MRIALGVEYDGSGYYGWQRQQEVASIQGLLEQVIGSVADHGVELVCAGRTDAGVHATGQVVHFDAHKPRELAAWTLGVNSRLPDAIAVRWAKPVSDEFHARFSASARRYRYVIYNARLRPAVLRRGLTHIHYPLDAGAMHLAAQCLVGEQDFTSFRAAQCQSKSPFRNVMAVAVVRMGDYVVVEIQANAFLHHMVRNIVGTLLMVGRGEQPPSFVAEVLAARDRNRAGMTAEAHGLYLVEVSYPSRFGLPSPAPGPLFLPQQPLCQAQGDAAAG